jgi:effector-binding domain-containing protein
VYEIQTRDVPEQKVLSTQRNVVARDLPAFIDEAGTRQLAHLAAVGIEPAGAAFVVYHGEVNEDSDGPVEVCLPFTGAVEPADQLGVRLEPAHTEAYARITKGECRFPEILRAYDAVSGWLEQAGRKPSQPPREVYFVDFSAVADDEPAADIALFREDGSAVARREREELRFAPLPDGTFALRGDASLLDGHPDALRRAWAALANPNAGDVLVSAAEGVEFADLGGRHHVGGGSHGSLVAGDSIVPVLTVGVEGEPGSIVDLAPLVLRHFGIAPPPYARMLAHAA